MAVSQSYPSKRPTPFVVVGLPRSRTAWLAEFLSHEGRQCWHEGSTTMRDFQGLIDGLNHGWAVSDTMLALRLLDVAREVPDLRIVVIRRQRAAVYAAMQRLGLPIPIDFLERLDDALDVAETLPDARSFTYEELNQQHTCGAIFRHCLGQDMPASWWHLMSRKVVVCDHKAVLDRALKNHRGFQAIYGSVL